MYHLCQYVQMPLSTKSSIPYEEQSFWFSWRKDLTACGPYKKSLATYIENVNIRDVFTFNCAFNTFFPFLITNIWGSKKLTWTN